MARIRKPCKTCSKIVDKPASKVCGRNLYCSHACLSRGRRNTEEKFNAAIDRSGGPDACWPWLGRLSKSGYGVTVFGGRAYRAHRKAWMFANGPVPAGLEILHSCDNRRCCNLRHLSAGTHAENMAQMAARGRANKKGNGMWAARTHCPQGHPYDAENTIHYKGSRLCRTCQREHKKAWNAKQKAARLSGLANGGAKK